MQHAWAGFNAYQFNEIRYASNGDFGHRLVKDRLQRAAPRGDGLDVLGVLVSESALGMYLRWDGGAGQWFIDLSAMARYEPMPGYARLGGQAFFELADADAKAEAGGHGGYGRLRTTRIIDASNVTHTVDSADVAVTGALKSGRWVRWKLAEKQFIASPCKSPSLLSVPCHLPLEKQCPTSGTTCRKIKISRVAEYRKQTSLKVQWSSAATRMFSSMPDSATSSSSSSSSSPSQ